MPIPRLRHAAERARGIRPKQLLPLLVVGWAICLLLVSIRDIGRGESGTWEDADHEKIKEANGEKKSSDDYFKGGLVLKGHMWCYDTSTLKLPENRNKTQCMCETGWSGDACNVPVCEPACERGRCARPGKCVCPRGWKGRLCSEPICDTACRHGDCTEPNTCTCDDGWHGATCQVHCEHGNFQQDNIMGTDRLPPVPCRCRAGWHGTACNRPDCSKAGCKNGVCNEPNKCKCDAGWAGRDCSVDMLAHHAKGLLQGLSPRDRRFSSMVVHRGSRPDSWRLVKLWTNHLPAQYAVSRWRLVDFVPVNDTIAGHNRYGGGSERWERCAVVGDGFGLLNTHLGAVIDKHHAVLRLNNAPSAKFVDHVGSRTTFRLLNRKSAFNLAAKASMPAKKRGALWGSTTANPSLLLWRPETYHIYAHVRKKLPYEDLNILRTEFLQSSLEMYREVLDRVIKAGIMQEIYTVGEEDRDLRKPDDGEGDQTIVGGNFRIPSSFIGVAFMMQLCKQVNLFGFDPPSVRERVRQMGISQNTYYDGLGSSYTDLAREDQDEIDFLSPLADPKAPGTRAQTKESVTAEGDIPGGERFSGVGGKALGGHYDYLLIRLLELHNLVKVCYTDHPERCISTWKSQSGARRKFKRRR